MEKIDKARNDDRSRLLNRLACRLPESWSRSKETVGIDSCGPPDKWFWKLLDICRKRWTDAPQDQGTWRLTELDKLARANRSSDFELEQRGFVLETAIQLSRLAELPNEPLVPQAIEELEQIYQSLERIRRWVGGDVRAVLRHAEEELRAAADKLETHLPIDWER